MRFPESVSLGASFDVVIDTKTPVDSLGFKAVVDIKYKIEGIDNGGNKITCTDNAEGTYSGSAITATCAMPRNDANIGDYKMLLTANDMYKISKSGVAINPIVSCKGQIIGSVFNNNDTEYTVVGDGTNTTDYSLRKYLSENPNDADGACTSNVTDMYQMF